MDLSPSIEARSDQINADDLIDSPATYTVREVINGKAEQPFDFLLVETERAYRPSKTMRRIIARGWGRETANYPGRRFTLYREPSIKFGGATVGGIRISHMSHLENDKPFDLMLQTSRGKREKFVIQPLSADAPTTPAEPTAEEVAACVDVAELKVMWKRSGAERRAQIETRVADLNDEPA